VQINELAAQCYLKETNLPIDRWGGKNDLRIIGEQEAVWEE
jgi:hypothetical protein